MQLKSTFFEFLDVYSSLQFCPPPPPRKLFRGLLQRTYHVETENSSIVQIESAKFQLLVQWRKPAHDENENVVLMQTELRLHRRTSLSWAQKVADVSVFWTVNCSVCDIPKVQTQMWPVLGCKMTRCCYMTRSIIHYVHDHNFEKQWLLYVNREQLYFLRCILTTSILLILLIQFQCSN